MVFTKWKKSIFSRPDKSNKGSIDLAIRALIEAINSSPHYCTTSSCSGRIVISLHGGKKNETTFLFMSHNTVSPEQVKTAPSAWFRFEPAIVHVACDDMKSTQIFLEKAKTGFKR